MFSSQYSQFLTHGPFTDQPDPFAENGHYFHQIHSGMIGQMLSQIGGTLVERGYIASIEASLQIAEMRKPDVAIFDLLAPSREKQLDYAVAASASLVEPGIAVEIEEIELQSIHIRHMASGQLVTIVEVISPRNKTHLVDMAVYQAKRLELYLERGVNVIEIDLTRSVKRLIEHPLTTRHPYHTAVLIPGELARIIPLDLNAPLKKFALPLLESVIIIDLQTAYNAAYRNALVAPQLENDTHYGVDFLPFPSLLSETEYQAIAQAVARWHEILVRLRDTTP